MRNDDERYTMGTTGTPGRSGADTIDEDDAPNGSAIGIPATTLGGEPDDPELPYDHAPGPDDKLHMPRNAVQRGD
ncbi:hypothetical protein KZZ52_28480 [Dactylosporangium sp. AC04546]|uniref:hypothetical protein n=1 Tax=Dactylosporangium sp. AC04546 TaxID=2862460 RepID=UPI001EDEC52D|nr:hypothetical protein [Dactylosporangium sp. AC04546]WVK89207.1 hypothetical protein KZZ52_28480 [Dactylosporangium sp. AC04546]